MKCTWTVFLGLILVYFGYPGMEVEQDSDAGTDMMVCHVHSCLYPRMEWLETVSRGRTS